MIKLTNQNVKIETVSSIKSYQHDLKKKMMSRTANIAVIGLGYVGLPTACHYANEGYKVTGFDVSMKKVETLNNGKSYINDVTSEQVSSLVNEQKFIATTDMKLLRKMDVILICVPTPVNEAKEPDLSYVQHAGKIISEYATKGTFIILESTTYPGTTEKYIVKPLEERGFVVGKTIFVAYSPERIDPGNKDFNLSNTPKVIGGMTEACTELGCQFIGPTAFRVNGIRVAELSKVFENTFRWINMALVNELTVLCNDMDIDIWETINAASSKPYGFMKFTPGIGVGGHCIPVDPYYLTYKAKQQGHRTKMIELAGEINDGMVQYSYIRILEILAEHDRLMKHSKIVILGAAYKKDIGDLRESPVIRLIEKLQNKAQKITVIEPFAHEMKINGQIQYSKEYDPILLKEADLVIIGTPHSCFNWRSIYEHSNLIFDSKNILEEKGYTNQKIIRL